MSPGPSRMSSSHASTMPVTRSFSSAPARPFAFVPLPVEAPGSTSGDSGRYRISTG